MRYALAWLTAVGTSWCLVQATTVSRPAPAPSCHAEAAVFGFVLGVALGSVAANRPTPDIARETLSAQLDDLRCLAHYQGERMRRIFVPTHWHWSSGWGRNWQRGQVCRAGYELNRSGNP